MALHSEPLEWVWTGIATAGTLLSIDVLRVALSDRRAVEHLMEGDANFELECAIVNSDVESAWWILGQEIVALAIGGLALFSARPASGRTTFGWVIVFLFIVFASVLPIRLLRARHRRRMLLRRLEHRRRHRPSRLATQDE